MVSSLNPSYYQFGDVETIQISEQLTSNAGQAVQYIARSCRVDGVVKGDPLEDLRKARWFVDREIGRLGGDDLTSANGGFSEPLSLEDWREFPAGTRFTDNDGDEYLRSELGAVWAKDSFPASGIEELTEEYAPYTEVLDG